MSAIRVGLIRCDTHGLWYGPLMASHDPRVHVGLESDRFDRIEVLWPDGSFQQETFGGGPADRQITLNRGQGTGTEANGQHTPQNRE